MTPSLQVLVAYPLLRRFNPDSGSASRTEGLGGSSGRGRQDGVGAAGGWGSTGSPGRRGAGSASRRGSRPALPAQLEWASSRADCWTTSWGAGRS